MVSTISTNTSASKHSLYKNASPRKWPREGNTIIPGVGVEDRRQDFSPSKDTLNPHLAEDFYSAQSVPYSSQTFTEISLRDTTSDNTFDDF